MKQKVANRILIVLLSVVMLITALPLNSLIAFAAGSGGGRAGGGTVSAGYCQYTPIDGEGVRMYIIDTKNNNSPVPFTSGGKTYWAIDAWEKNKAIWDSYGYGDSEGEVYYDTGLRAWGQTLAASGLYKTTYANIGFGGYINSDFVVDGNAFYNWMTGDSGKKLGNTDVNMQTWLMYNIFADKNSATLKKLMNDDYYLVVEPLGNFPVYDCFTSGGLGGDGTDYYYTIRGSWMDYIQDLYGVMNDSEGGWQNTKAKDTYGNGFRLENRSSSFTGEEKTKYEAALNKMLTDTGFSIPTENIKSSNNGVPVCKPSHIISRTKNGTTGAGWGVQVYWCNTGGVDVKEPIDSYYINKTPSPPSTPDYCETPDEKNNTKGEKTIVKLYVDMYLKANSNTEYTAARDFGTYTRTLCSSDIVISDESSKNGGYHVYAWYTSQTPTSSNAYKGSAMIKKTYISQDSTLGSELFEIGGYNAFDGLKATGSKAWVKHTGGGISTKGGGKQYTRTKTLPERIKNADKQYISLTDDENTLVILYVREHGSIDTSSSDEPDDPPKDPYRELKIVKCYGTINPITYEVTNDKPTVYWESKTRNVHITPESGYRLAEYVYCTRGDTSNWSSMTAANWGKPTSTDPTKHKELDDNSFYLKGFVDGFSKTDNDLGSGKYSNQYAWSETAQNSDSIGFTYTGNTDYPGAKGKGRLSGKLLKDYDKTIYFGPSLMEETATPKDTSTDNDVLYILFIKEDEVTYETGTFGIPESYLTRWNNYATNNIKVKSSNTKDTDIEYCQKPTIYITSK